MQQRVAVIGEGVIDRFLEPDGPRDVIGGSPLNTAVAMRRAGLASDWWARISLDAEGSRIADYAKLNQVAGPAMTQVPLPTSIVTVELQAGGVPRYGFHLDGAADWSWQPRDFAGLSDYDVVQIGSLTAVLQPGADALLDALKQLRTMSPRPLISYDPNARPKAANDEAQADFMRTRVNALVGLADLVKVSDEDLEWLFPGQAPEASAAAWSNLGPNLVVLTRGSEGSKAYVAGSEIASVPGVQTEVVDTVGAGDTFMAWLVRGIAVDHHNAIPTDELSVAALLARAGAAAAVTCSRKGCNPPTLAELG